MIRTRFAPSPTGYMHIGNLRTALYEYLIAKSKGGKFILRIEDTDQERLVDGATEVIYKTLATAGLCHDEGPDIGGPYGPYIQSERRGSYREYAEELISRGKAYRCFCTKERLESLKTSDGAFAKYDRHCMSLSKEEAAEKMNEGVPYVVRQIIPAGETTFHDEVYGDITVPNDELEDQVLLKSDGLPTYNFANVVDDHLMEITHVLRGSEYLSSTPKYNLLYEAFGWDIPVYMHLPLILNSNGEKLSKRKGDASFEDLIEQGFLPEAVVNYIALLGWSPEDNREIFSLGELIESFNPKGLSKSPSIFDLKKLTWMNGEYIKALTPQKFFQMAEPYLRQAVKTPGVDLERIAGMVQTRVEFVRDVVGMLDFIDALPEYDIEMYVHKKMKTTLENSPESLERVYEYLKQESNWSEDVLHQGLLALAADMGVKNGQILWPVRTALSGKAVTPCGATELLGLLGKEESLRRIEKGLEMLKAAK